jgi:hypothetical protein
MADSIIDLTLGMLSPEMQQLLAIRLGESSQSIRTGLAAASAAILDGLATKVDDVNFAAQILACVTAAAGQNVRSELVTLASAGPTGAMAELVNRVLPMVFGSQPRQVAYALAQQCGVSAASGTGLLNMSVPLLLAVFDQAQSTRSLDARTLADMLHGAAPELRRYLPSALLGSAAGIARAVPAQRPRANGAELRVPPRWLVPTALAAALLLAWLVIRAFTAPKETPAAGTVTAEETKLQPPSRPTRR